MKQNFKRKLMAGLLSVCMMFQTAGIVPVYAAENVADSGLSTGTSNVCTHHVHDEKCGYTEGTPCNHLHTEECSTAEGSTKELACKHVHDDKCGYKESKPCTFDPATCESCKAKNTVDNRATLANEVYAVYDGSKFYAATADAPSTATAAEITDKTSINHLYIMGGSVPNDLMYASPNANTTLKTVTCANTVTTIGNFAFFNCTSLTSVVLPEATTIDNEAFFNCTSLTSVAMPKVTNIGEKAFQQCGKLASPEMPKVTTLGKWAFMRCTAFTSVAMPNATTIGTSAFNGCTGLASVNMPNAITIGDRAFSGCTGLASLTLGATPPTTVGTEAFFNCPTPRTLTIQGNTADVNKVLAAYKAVADGVTDELWYGWTLPATMEVSPSAGTLAVTGNSAPTVGKENSITLTATFDKAANMGKQKALATNQVEFKDGATPLGTATATQNTDGKWVATLTADTKSWAVGAHTLTAEFAGNGELGKSTTTEVTVTVNEVYAVYDGTKFCEATAESPTKPTSTVILDTNKKTINHLYIMGASVPTSLMSSCTNLKTVICADTVTTIGNEAFSDCAKLASVEMPKVTKIGDSAFWGCTILTSLTLGATPPTVVADPFSFYGCPTSTLTIQGNTAYQTEVLNAYKAVVDGGTAGDNLWWGWTLPTEIVATSSAGTLTATGNSSPTFGNENTITLTATFDEVAKVGKQRALAINQVEFKDGAKTLGAIATATQNADGKWVATITTNTKDWAVGAHNLTAEYAGNHELGGSTTNEVTVTVNGSYGVYDEISKKFWRATAEAPTVPTTTEITDKNAISHLYIMGKSVPKSLMGDWQNPCLNLKTVICADTVTTIGTNAFQKCTNLTSVAMPNVTTIGKSAFYYCKSLASVAIPKVKAISAAVFVNCKALASVDVSGANTIDLDAFADCTSLTSVALPKVTAIGNTAFSGCKSLASLTLGETPPTVGTEAFLNCPTPRTLIIQGNTANSEAVLAAYKAAADDSTADNLWYGWTLPATMVVSPSAGTLAVSNATTIFGKENSITLTATFDKAANMGKQRALTINQVEFKDGTTALGTATAKKNTDGKWVATLTVNTNTWVLGEHKLTAEFAGNSELSNSTTNEVTVTVNESYAVRDGGKFYEATQTAPTVPTATVILDSETINHVYIMGENVPGYLIGSWNAPEHTNLKTVICADTVTTISDHAFYKCTGLTSVKLPSVITIENDAFNGCTSLASVEMPKVTTIGTSAFMNCTKLANVALPNVTTIGESAFYQCTSLASLTISATPPTVGKNAFYKCPKTNPLTIQGNPDFKDTVLAAYNTADGNTAGGKWYGWTLPATLDGKGVSTSTGKLTATGNPTSDFGKSNAITLTATFDKAAKIGRGALTINQVEFKDGANTLGAIATATKNADGKWLATLNVNTKDFTVGTHTLTATFAGNHELFGSSTTNAVTVTVNESYAVYDGTTFYRATKADPTTATAEEIISADKNTINHLYVTGTSPLMGGCTNLTSVAMPNATEIGKQAFYGCTSLASVTMPKVGTIGDGAFTECTSLATIELPEATAIGIAAFAGCTGLSIVTMPKVTSIGDSAFSSSKALTSINMPKIITIGGEAFMNCTGLASVEMSNVTTIGNSAFMNCTSLASVEMSSAISIGERAFYGCANLTSVAMPSATSIGERAFYDCKGLKSIAMPNVTSISEKAFYKCTGLASVTMPKVTKIGNNAFTECTSLATIELPEATAIGIAAFAGCAKLETIKLPNVTSIGDSAFSSSKALTNINMPKVTAIGQEAFMNCTSLASVEMSNVTTIDNSAFMNCTSLASVEMSNVTTIGNSAFNSCEKLVSVAIPKVTTIGDRAFVHGTKLESLTLGVTPPTVGKLAFFLEEGVASTRNLIIQGNPAFKDTVLAAYKAVDDGVTDELWWDWTLPTALDGTGVSKSEGKLTAAGSVAVDYGTANTITFTASFAKVGENKLKTLVENQISLLNGGVVVESKTVALTNGVYSATFTVNTKDFTAGTYNYTATFDGNRSLVGGAATETVTVTVNKANQAALNFDGVPTTATYGDSKITLATKGGTGTGTVAYSSAAADVVADDGTIKGIGTATITATKAGGTNYNDATATTTITVNAAVPTIAWADAAETLSYTGSVAWITKMPTVTLANGEPFHGTIQYAYKETGLFSLFTGYTDGLPTNAGEYTIKAHIAAEGNYTEAESTNTMALTISRVDNSINNSSTTSMYYGESFLVEYSIANTDTTQPIFTCEYKEKSAAENTYTTTLPTNAGNYTMRVSATATQNYNACTATQDFEIKKVPLNVTAGTVEPKKWDGTKTTTVTGLTFQNQITYKILEGNEKLAIGTDFIVTKAEYATANVGMNIIYATVALQNTTKANNYFLPSENGGVFPFTGTPIALADGPATPTFSTMDDEMGKDTFTFNSTSATVYEYSKDSGATWTDITASGATTAITVGNVALAAGALQVRIKATATHNASGVLANTAEQVFTASIEGSVAITGTATYGETLTATVSGQQSGAVLSYKWLAGTTELQSGTSNTYIIAGEAIGNTITVEVTAAGYTDSLTSTATTAVAKKAVTATAGTVSKVYDGTAAVETADRTLTITKVNASDDITITAANAAYNNANIGTGKAITLGDLSISGAAAGWYDVTAPIAVTGEITVKALTGATVIVGGTYIYTGTAITPTAENVTVKDGTTTLVNGTDYSYAASDNTSAGTATVTVTFKGNYSGTAIKTFIIAKADPTYSIPTALTAKYGQPLSTVNISATNGFSWMDGTTNVGAVGTQTHKAKFTPTDTANYNTVENIDVTVTVGKADALALNSSAIMVKKQANYTVKLDMAAVSGYPAIPGGTPTFAIADSTSNGLIGATIDVDGKTLVLVANNTTNDTADTVIVNVTGMGNYNDSTITVAVSYTDKTFVTITGVTVQDGTYHGGTQKGYIGTPTSAFSGSYDVTYIGRDGTTYNSANAPKIVGDYTVKISVPDSDAAYCGSISLNFTVSKATVTIKADNKSAYVGDTQPALTYTATGLATDEILQTVPTLTCTSDMSKAGSYEIIVSGAAVPNTDNYNSDITYTAGTLTVSTRPSSGGGDDSSSGSGSTVTPTPAPTPAPTPKATDGDNDAQNPKPTTQKPTVGKTTAAAEVDADGKATVTVPEKSITDAITNAQQTAKKNGTEENGISVEIEVTGGENINSVSTTLSEESIKELTSAGVKEVTFKSEMADVTLDLETLQQIQKEQGDDVTITVSKADISSLDEKTKAEIGDRPVYELNLTRADGTRVTNFDGSITIAIPYILQEGEDPANIAVVYINEKGEKEIMNGSGYDEKTQSVIFTTRHFSTFAIVLMPDKNDAPITDIEQADGTTQDVGNANETANAQGGISTGIMVTIVIAAILAIAIVAGGVFVIVKKRRE